MAAKHHVTRLAPPTHRARGRIRPVWRSYSTGHFVFQNRADDAQTGFPGQLLHLGLQLLPHLNHRQRHLQQLPLAEHFELLLGLALHSLIAFLHSGSPLENRVCNPNSIRVRVESRCFLFQVSTKGGTTSMASQVLPIYSCTLCAIICNLVR